MVRTVCVRWREGCRTGMDGDAHGTMLSLVSSLAQLLQPPQACVCVSSSAST